jgi:hypothetical protein
LRGAGGGKEISGMELRIQTILIPIQMMSGTTIGMKRVKKRRMGMMKNPIMNTMTPTTMTMKTILRQMVMKPRPQRQMQILTQSTDENLPSNLLNIRQEETHKSLPACKPAKAVDATW